MNVNRSKSFLKFLESKKKNGTKINLNGENWFVFFLVVQKVFRTWTNVFRTIVDYKFIERVCFYKVQNMNNYLIWFRIFYNGLYGLEVLN